MISSGAGVWHCRMRGLFLHEYPKRRRVQLTFGAAIGQRYLNPTMLSSFGFLVCVNTGGMIQWCTVSDRAHCLQSASLNSLNQPVAGILINKLLECRLAQCMHITGGLLMLTGGRAGWLVGDHRPMEHPDFLPELPVSPVTLFTRAQEAVRKCMNYKSNTDNLLSYILQGVEQK